MDYNYHAHTQRCHHASGTPEEYIKRAVDNGIKYMGFSDHIPFVLDDGSQSSYRVRFAEGKEYVDEIRALRERYKNEIELSVGFESEYYRAHFDRMLGDATDFGAEYLILGQHFINSDVKEELSSKRTEDENKLRAYADSVVEAIESGYFSYVAHPDVLNYVGEREIYKREMRKICAASRKSNIPLEINFLGIRNGRHYPNKLFWEIAGEEGSPVTFGFDAHEVQAAYDGQSLERAKQLVKEFNLNYIGRPSLIALKK